MASRIRSMSAKSVSDSMTSRIGLPPTGGSDGRRSFPLRHKCFKGAALVLFTGLVLAASAQAAKPSAATTADAGPDLGKCLDLTGRTGIRTKHITDNLGLTPDQVRETRSRLSSYWSVRGFAGLDGIGLTAEQQAEIMRRLGVEVKRSSWPLGWPCKPFTHRSKVIKFVVGELVANGFRPRMQVIGSAPRQIRISAIQDGLPFIVLVVRAGGPRTILVSLKPAGTGYAGDSASYTLPYTP